MVNTIRLIKLDLDLSHHLAPPAASTLLPIPHIINKSL